MSKFNLIKFLTVGSLLVSSVAMAATGGSITLGGSVAPSLALVSTPTGAATTLDLTVGEHIVMVSLIEMTTNNDQGLTLTASAGNLTKAGGVAIAYQTTSVVGGVSTAAPITTDFVGGSYQVGSVAAGPLVKDLYIKYTVPASQDPGAYTGSITLSVADNA